MCISHHDTPGGWNLQKKGAGVWGVGDELITTLFLFVTTLPTYELRFLQ